MSDSLPKQQPAEFACPRCGDAIAWRACLQCGGIGAWEFVANSHCGVPQSGKFCSECGAALLAWREDCAFCAGRGWLAADHVCRAADQPPAGRPFRVDPATRPPLPATAAAALTEAAALPPLQPSAPPASPAPTAAVAAVAATPALPASEPAAAAVSPQPAPDFATVEPKRKNRMNLWIALVFLLILIVLIISPETADTIRRSFQAVFVR